MDSMGRVDIWKNKVLLLTPKTRGDRSSRSLDVHLIPQTSRFGARRPKSESFRDIKKSPKIDFFDFFQKRLECVPMNPRLQSQYRFQKHYAWPFLDFERRVSAKKCRVVFLYPITVSHPTDTLGRCSFLLGPNHKGNQHFVVIIMSKNGFSQMTPCRGYFPQYQ